MSTAVVTWVLVLSLLKNDGAYTSQYGPYLEIKDCQAAGAKWLDNQVGNTFTYVASWQCRPLITKETK